MKLYIATPINARPEATFEKKYTAARHYVEALKGILEDDPSFSKYDEMVSSFDLNKLNEVSESEAMGRCIQAVLECDAIYLAHSWQSSKGCNLEYRAAKIYGKTIYEHDKL